MGSYLLVYQHPVFEGFAALHNLLATLLGSIPFVAALWFGAKRLEEGKNELAIILVGAVALRLCVPLESLVGSEDAYRYLWDGLVQSHGINPYLHPPLSPQLEHLREPLFFPYIFRPDLRTVYPPLAEGFFWLAHRLTPTSVVGWKMILLIHELASTYLLYRLLQQHQKPTRWSILYAWSPLPIIQGSAAGHLDSLLVPWLLVSLILAERRPFAAAVALAAATMVRPVYALCLGALIMRRQPKESLVAGVGFFGAVALMVLPYADAGWAMLESLFVYGEHWRFNGSLYQLIEPLWGNTPHFRYYLYGGICVLAGLSSLLPISRPARYLMAVGCYFVFAPTIYPWYLQGMLAIGGLYWGPLVMAFPALIGISDLVVAVGVQGGHWQVPRAALWLEYLGIYGLLLYQLLGQRISQRWR
jgi:alpha-1,6-mannosyltransferase